MNVIETPGQLRKQIAAWKRDGLRVAFVPTMGFLHEGHLSLMRLAGQKADRLVISIFVNPRQFGPDEDLDKYPRDEKRDRALAESVGVDLLFLPTPSDLYPDGYQTNVSVTRLKQGLCGASRPVHFDGVATVITKLFNLVDPDVAVFGEKDFQQLALIRRLVLDLNFPIEIIGHPIVREADGLALSSRNKYLTAEERLEALVLSRSLQYARECVAAHCEINAGELQHEVEKIITASPACSVDYISLVHPESLEPVAVARKGTLLALAVYINGKVRLIDNTIL